MIADTGLVVPFPDVEYAVGEHRQKFDPRAPLGVPAHVTIHFPWIPADRVDAAAPADVRERTATTEPFAGTFEELRWFGSEVLWPAPRPLFPG